MKERTTGRKNSYKKLTSLTLACMLGATVIPTVNGGTAYATTDAKATTAATNTVVEAESVAITAEQVGNRKAFIKENLRSDIGTNLQPTGLAVQPGDVLEIYVDVDDTSKLPKIVFTQQEGSWASWKQSFTLRKGKNTITTPTIKQVDKYSYNVTAGGTIYIENPYTAEEQGKAPVIHIKGATQIPYMTKDTKIEDFKASLEDYVKKLNNGTAKINVVELVSDHLIYTGTATGAYNTFVKNGVNPQVILNGYDTWMHNAFEVNGLDDTNTSLIREHIRIMQPWGLMYATGDHTGIRSSSEHLMFLNLGKSYAGWALDHEIGHRIDIGEREYLEVTNNMSAMLMGVKYGNISNRIPFENMYKYLIKENAVNMASRSLSERLGAFWQLELAYPNYWANLERLYRERKISVKTDNEKQQYIVKFSSEVVNKDLSSYFERHGFTVNEETKKELSKYEKPNKIWYLNNSVINYKGNGFDKNTKVTANVMLNKVERENILYISIDEDNKDDLLGYEILRNGEVVGFTTKDTFIDTGIEPDGDYTYQVVAYDKKLNPVKSEYFVAVEDPAVENIDKIVQTIKKNLANSDLDNITSLYFANPKDIISASKGTDEEEKLKASIQEELDDSVKGTYIVSLYNPKGVSVEELLKNNLSIMYQTERNSAFFKYSNGNVVNRGEVIATIDTRDEKSQVEANINKIKDSVRKVLTSQDIIADELSDIYIINPKVEGYKGTDMDMKFVELVEIELEGNVTGTYGIHLQYTKGKSIDELIENHLLISYQLKDGRDYYVYSNNKLEKW